MPAGQVKKFRRNSQSSHSTEYAITAIHGRNSPEAPCDMKASAEAMCAGMSQYLFSRDSCERTAPAMVTAVKNEYSACDEAICETVKQPVMLAQTHAARREALRDWSFAAFDAAQAIPTPDNADQKRTANSPQPKSRSESADSHHVSIVFPVSRASPIRGTKRFPEADMWISAEAFMPSKGSIRP